MPQSFIRMTEPEGINSPSIISTDPTFSPRAIASSGTRWVAIQRSDFWPLMYSDDDGATWTAPGYEPLPETAISVTPVSGASQTLAAFWSLNTDKGASEAITIVYDESGQARYSRTQDVR